MLAERLLDCAPARVVADAWLPFFICSAASRIGLALHTHVSEPAVPAAPYCFLLLTCSTALNDNNNLHFVYIYIFVIFVFMIIILLRGPEHFHNRILLDVAGAAQGIRFLFFAFFI